MKNDAFKRMISQAEVRENIVGSALARAHKAMINFNPKDGPADHPKTFDYLLFDPVLGWQLRCEQQCDFHLSDLASGNLLFELFTHRSTGKAKGKLGYCRADRFIYNAPKLEKVFLLDFKKLKAFILFKQKSDQLNIITNEDNADWEAKHDSSPVDYCLLPIAETREALKESFKVKTYQELNISKRCISKT
jgi:hypothetical protein